MGQTAVVVMKNAQNPKGSRILGPLDAETERRLVLLVRVELDALAAVSVSGTFIVGTCAVPLDVCHDDGIDLQT